MVAAETSVADALAATLELSPSLLLLDKAFGIHAVMDCLKRLQDGNSRTAVVIWAGTLSEAEALRLIQSGASGVIRKTATVDALMECLRAVAAGDTWVEQGLIRDQELAPPKLSRTALTAREMQVMDLVERGLKNKEIGQKLGIRTGTVKIHLKHIFEKTGIRGRYGLALSGLKAKGLLAMPLAEA